MPGQHIVEAGSARNESRALEESSKLPKTPSLSFQSHRRMAQVRF